MKLHLDSPLYSSRCAWRAAISTVACLGTAILSSQLASAEVVQARHSDAFVESLGTGTRFDFISNDGQIDGAIRALQQIGFRYIRAGLMGEGSDQNVYWANMRRVGAEAGVKICLTTWWNTFAELDHAANQFGGYAYAIEGVNESWNPPAGVPYPNSLELQKVVWQVGSARGWNVYSWSLGGPPDYYKGMPNTEAWCTHGTIHPYHWYGNADERWIPQKASAGLFQGFNGDFGNWEPGFIGCIRNQMVPNKPLVITEVGWDGEGGREAVVSNEAKKRYNMRALLEAFNAGIIRTYQYNLIERHERNYGLADFAGNLNDTGVALRNLIALTKDPGAPHSAGNLDYSLSVASGMSTVDDHEIRNTEIHRTLLQKRDGTFQLILWVDGDSHKTNVPAETVTLNLGQTVQAIRRYEPIASTNVLQTWNNTNSITFPVPDHPVIIEISGAGPIQLPDLVVTDVSWTPANPVAGSAVTLSATIRNQGTASTAAGTSIGVGFNLGGQTVNWSDSFSNALAPNTSVTVTSTSGPGGTATWSATTGTHTVNAYVDDTNRIAESNEGNNTLSTNLVVAAGYPDLVVTDVSWNPVNPSAGNATSFSAAIRNQGTAATPAGTTIGVAFSVNGQVVNWSDNVSQSLPPNGVVTVTATSGSSGSATWLATSGTHSVSALVDDVNRIAESDEANNGRTESILVPIGGTGTGLTGFYRNSIALTGPVVLARAEAVNFDWLGAAPATGVNADNYSVSWTGQVEAPFAGNYIFRTVSDDGVRLWVDGIQVVNNWTVHGTTNNDSVAVALTAGQKVSLVMEYYEGAGGAVARLHWQRPGDTGFSAIPPTQLYTILPTPWVAQDIGAPGQAGSQSYNPIVGRWILNVGGADIWGTSDQFRLVCQNSAGDCDISARVLEVENTDPWAKAGVMIRENTSANNMFVMMAQRPDNQVSLQWRSSTGGGALTTALVGGTTAVKWVRISRVGNVFRGYYKTTSTGAWTELDADPNTTGTQGVTLSMSTNAKIGVYGTAHNNGTLSTAGFDSIVATP